MKKIKKVAIIGFPNVGKSTLFNRLLGRKKALVHSLPGMTRDQVSSPCRIQDKSFLLIDTGGLTDARVDPYSDLVREKVWEASRNADLILLVLDGKRAPAPAEEELRLSLRKLDKPVLVVVNKVDSATAETGLGDFSRFAGDFLSISAEHKRNLQELEDRIYTLLPEMEAAAEEEAPLRIALVGRINVGKSSLVNRLCGQEKLIVSEIPGTTRDCTDTIVYRDKKAYCLVDTAGIRKLSRTRDKREQAGIVKAKKDIGRADVICLILDAQEFPTRQDTAIAHIAMDSGKPLIIALNKWDLMDKNADAAGEIRARIFDKLDFISYAPLIFVSALSGKGTVKILDTADGVFQNGKKITPTSQLNEFLEWIHIHHPPVSKKRSRMKFKYITQKGVLPPTFLLFTHSRLSLLPAYEKKFIRLLREAFDYSGTPLRIKLRRD